MENIFKTLVARGRCRVAAKRRPFIILERSQFTLSAALVVLLVFRKLRHNANFVSYIDFPTFIFVFISSISIHKSNEHFKVNLITSYGLTHEPSRYPPFGQVLRKNTRNPVQINLVDVSITALFAQELVSGEANKMDRGVNTNLHPLFVSAERRRKKHRNLIGFGAAGGRISYSPVRPANTIICRSTEKLFFSIPLFSNFTSAPCFSE